MKLIKEEIIRTADASPLKLFEQGIKTELTRRNYTATLRRVMCEILEDILAGDFEERTRQFVQNAKDDPDWATDIMLNVSRMLRERTELPKDDPDYLNPTSLPAYFKPIKKLFDMNNVSIPWKRVFATFPEADNIHDTKGWTRDEIAAMLEHTRDLMDKAMVLVLASSGVRLGGLELTWGDLTPIYLVDGRLTADPDKDGEVACVALNVYAGSSENYTAFATPEAYRALQAYGRTWAEMMKCQAGPKDPIFLATKLLPRPIKTPAIAMRIRRMASKAGLRNQDSKNGPRFNTQLVHGFRKFFNKTCKEAMSGDTVAVTTRLEYMMGHRGLVALDRNYFKTDMLEMAAVYLEAVPDLTISDVDRLKNSTQRMSANIQELESKDASIDDLQKKVADLEKHNREVTGELERVKSEKGISSESAESIMEIMHRMKKDHDADIVKIKAEGKEDMDRMRVVVEKMMRVIHTDSETIDDLIAEVREVSGDESRHRNYSKVRYLR